MNRFVIFVMILFFSLSSIYSKPIKAVSNPDQDVLKGSKIPGFPFYVYTDGFSGQNHYAPSGWMGDYGDIRIKELWRDNPKYGRSCMQILYKGSNSQGAGWAGIYWQNPPNNWGGLKGGYNLTGAKRLFFYARGETGEEYVEFKMGGLFGRYSDSTAGNRTDAIRLSKEWTLYAIDLDDMDLSYIAGGFCIAFSTILNPHGALFYLDEVYYYDKNIPLDYNELISNQNIDVNRNTVITININSIGITYMKSMLKIAVLPFDNTSGSRDLEYLSKTISESISTSLGKEKKLKVLDLDTINKKLQSLNMTLDDFNILNGDVILGKILNVDTVIRGSYVEMNNRILINTKLVDIRNGTIITSDQIQGDLRKDVFLLLDKTSQNILQQIVTLNSMQPQQAGYSNENGPRDITN